MSIIERFHTLTYIIKPLPSPLIFSIDQYDPYNNNVKYTDAQNLHQIYGDYIYVHRIVLSQDQSDVAP